MDWLRREGGLEQAEPREDEEVGDKGDEQRVAQGMETIESHRDSGTSRPATIWARGARKRDDRHADKDTRARAEERSSTEEHGGESDGEKLNKQRKRKQREFENRRNRLDLVVASARDSNPTTKSDK